MTTGLDEGAIGGSDFGRAVMTAETVTLAMTRTQTPTAMVGQMDGRAGGASGLTLGGGPPRTGKVRFSGDA